jgi:thiol-disulfide isomerase/thioredoxin
VSRADLKGYESWKTLFAAAPYVPDTAAVAAIKAGAKDVTVLLIMATWCPDSKRELPRYFAIMDAADVADSTLTMVGVDRSKKDAESLTEKWGITRVPTFVFLRNGLEVGRFVERVPAGSTLEAEIAKVFSDKQGTAHTLVLSLDNHIHMIHSDSYAHNPGSSARSSRRGPVDSGLQVEDGHDHPGPSRAGATPAHR